MSTTDKKQLFETLLATETDVSVIFYPLSLGVDIPNFLKEDTTENSSLVFLYNISTSIPVPITDLKTTEHGISATLSFNMTPQYTFVPWTAIFVMVNHDTQIIFKNETLTPLQTKSATQPTCESNFKSTKKSYLKIVT